MKNKALIFSLLALVVLLVVATVLYNSLIKDYTPQQLTVLTTTAPTEATVGATETMPAENSGEVAPTDSQETSVQDTEPTATEPATTELPFAPDFTVYDAEGNSYMLSDFRGKPVVLNFWASWCGPCKQEMPDFNTTYGKLGEEIHFLMVNLTDGYQETVESASSFIAGTGYTFPVYYDTSSEAAIAYGVYSIPTTYFIDAEGHAIAQATGAISADTLQRGIDMIYSPGE